MEQITRPDDLKKVLRSYQSQGYTIGFTPTMGALHEGHVSLARRAKKENNFSVMSIFVNPKQFGPNEDFDKYPRDLSRDKDLAASAKVDILFTPEAKDLYPDGYSTSIEETEISKGLCGVHRPGHFRGVCTVVFRLFQIVRPDRAYFGMKDAQQLRVIEKMTEDLSLGIQIVPCATVREKDGLALSSRNAYLTEDERTIAPELNAALRKSADAFGGGERSAERLIALAREHLSSFPRLDVQYMEIRRWRDFAAVETIDEKSVLAVAAFLGRTRLIDNVVIA